MEKLIWNYSFWLKRWNVYLLKFCPKKMKNARAYFDENLIFHILWKHSFVFQIIAFHNSQIVKTKICEIFGNHHWVKSTQIRSFYWSVFSRIRTEYGEIRGVSPYSPRMRENTDQKKLRIWTLFAQCKFNHIPFHDLQCRKKIMVKSKDIRQGLVYWISSFALLGAN